MKHYVFKSPIKKGDAPVEELSFEPPEYIVSLKAQKYGSITIISEADLAERMKSLE